MKKLTTVLLFCAICSVAEASDNLRFGVYSETRTYSYKDSTTGEISQNWTIRAGTEWLYENITVNLGIGKSVDEDQNYGMCGIKIYNSINSANKFFINYNRVFYNKSYESKSNQNFDSYSHAAEVVSGV